MKTRAQRSRQLLHAHLQNLEELDARVRRFRIAPLQRLAEPMAIGREQLVECFPPAQLRSRPRATPRGRNRRNWSMILCFRMADQPGLELRLAAEAVRSLERRNQSLRDGILGPGVVAQLKSRDFAAGSASVRQLPAAGCPHPSGPQGRGGRSRRISEDVSQRPPPIACMSA